MPTRLPCTWHYPSESTGLPFPPPGDHPGPGTWSTSPASAGGFLPLGHHRLRAEKLSSVLAWVFSRRQAEYAFGKNRCVHARLRVQLFGSLWHSPSGSPVPEILQECWSGLLFLPPGDLLDPDIEPMSLVSPALVKKQILFLSPTLKTP